MMAFPKTLIFFLPLLRRPDLLAFALGKEDLFFLACLMLTMVPDMELEYQKWGDVFKGPELKLKKLRRQKTDLIEFACLH